MIHPESEQIFYENLRNNRKDVIKSLAELNIKNYTIREDLTVDVHERVVIKDDYFLELPVKFGIIKGDFICWRIGLDNLKGCPQKVMGKFIVTGNRLTSFKYAPQIVGEDFFCNSNELTSLECAPKIINKNFHCQNNKLTSLEGGPMEIVGDFDCSFNKITSLDHAPQKVYGNFDCSYNHIETFPYENLFIKGKLKCCHKNEISGLESFYEKIGFLYFYEDFYGENLLNIQYKYLTSYFLSMKLENNLTKKDIIKATNKI